MRVKITNVLNNDGLPAYKLKFNSGGYNTKNVPEEYLKGEHFGVNKRSITFYTRVNPMNGEVSQGLSFHRIPLSMCLTSMQVERILSIMRVCGERLCKIKENIDTLAPPRFEEI